MKRSEIFFSITQVLLDWCAILAAGIFAFELRHMTAVQAFIKKEGIYTIDFHHYLYITVGFSFVILILYALEGLYAVRATRKSWHEIFLIAKATTIALMIIMVGFFLQREWFSSRFVIVVAWVLTIAFVGLSHMITRGVQKYVLIRKGVGRHRVLLIGRGEKLKYIHNTVERKPSLGYEIVKHIDYVNLKRIKKIERKYGIDEIIVNESEIEDELLQKLYDFCEIKDIVYKFVPTARQTTQFDMTFFAGEPLIVLRHTPLDGWGTIAKRIFDIIFGSLFLVLTAPFIFLAALAVKIEDPQGPVFFKNKRIGADGKEFSVYKIRYMKWMWCTTKDNPQYKKALAYERELIEKHSVRVGPIYKIKNDPRRLRVGTILERLSIDEFPQFLNVVKGEMSLVGPRPHQGREVKLYKEYHRRLLTIKPGITGMAQVSGRSDLNFEDEYRLDVFYIENWSFLLDFIILAKTLPAILKRRKNNNT